MKEPDTVSILSAQITIANWYLDRAAAHASAETSGAYVRYAQVAYEIVVTLLPRHTQEVSQRVQQELALLRERLRLPAGQNTGVDARANHPLLQDSPGRTGTR